ncbi:hypothetical protein TIFTF001_041420 [Ficus carica]|uniref:Uncharacterized protein n=1 Tax=Ficus carica TaxID=3494 RepID=A0AA87ZCZ0_FICCA|nr:hypothetical protein TIFTF001_041420 [Ficus carica]
MRNAMDMFVDSRYKIVVPAERKLTVLRLCCRRVVTELLSERFPAINFTVSLPLPPSLYKVMDPALVEEDRRSTTSFFASQPLFFDGTRQTVSLSVWLYDTELIFRTSHIVECLRVSLASRCLVADARLWWMTWGERALPERTWVHFRTLVITRYGPVPEEGADEPYRNPEIYRDMYHERFYSLVADWHAYPQECKNPKFQ